ncbi:MAG: triphosphoribosyl-dephospho-CoA synthase [Methylophilaceae bacterium]|nr:triphosphoribosyl-dephospho-CoA synthase [Methylophilaceae bacterium]
MVDTSRPFPETPAATLADVFESACLAELRAIKPGNVHVFADGHGMVVDDFVQSARAAAPVIAQPGLSVGQRILYAVEATWEAVACNTNLGIVLLAAPLIHAASRGIALKEVLDGLTKADAADAYRAIRLASPAGLGKSARHDVGEEPHVTLLEAMREAEERDRIARQYARGYDDIINLGLPFHRQAMARWDNESWATTAVYLGFLACFPDTHVVRKHGVMIAESLQIEARHHLEAFLACDNPKTYLGELLRFDTHLKARGLNPGTSADLTVATELVVSLEKVVR